MTNSSDRRNAADMRKLKQAIKAQNAIINTLLAKMDQLKSVCSLTMSPPVKEAIDAAFEAAGVLDENRKALHGIFLETEKVARSLSKPSIKHHSASLAH